MQLVKEKDNTIAQLNQKARSDQEATKEHYTAKIEVLEQQLLETELNKDQTIKARIQDLHHKESIFNENLTKYQKDLKDA